MAATTALLSGPNSVSSTPSSEVDAELDDFRDLVNIILDQFSSSASEQILRNAVKQLLEAVGQDHVKLHALVRIVQKKIFKVPHWSNLTGVPFYRILLKDEGYSNLVTNDFLKLDTGASDAELVTKYLVETFTSHFRELLNNEHLEDWRAEPVSGMPAFALKNIEDNGLLPPVSLACGLLDQMASSYFTYFGQNLEVFCDFGTQIGKLLDNAPSGTDSMGMTKVLHSAIKDDKERSVEQFMLIKTMVEDLGRTHLYKELNTDVSTEESELDDGAPPSSSDSHVHVHLPPSQSNYPPSRPYNAPESYTEKEKSRWGPYGTGQQIHQARRQEAHAETVGKINMQLLDKNPLWSSKQITRLMELVSRNTTIGMSLARETEAYSIIEAMSESDHLFSNGNLFTLGSFLFRIGPTLDGMADLSPSQRLTSLLESLHGKFPRAGQERDYTGGLLRSMGRSVASELLSGSDADEDDYVVV